MPVVVIAVCVRVLFTNLQGLLDTIVRRASLLRCSKRCDLDAVCFLLDKVTVVVGGRAELLALGRAMAAVAAVASVTRARQSHRDEDDDEYEMSRDRRTPSPGLPGKMEPLNSETAPVPEKTMPWHQGDRRSFRARTSEPDQPTDRRISSLPLGSGLGKMRKKTHLKPRFIIDPRYSKAAQYWDVVTMFALLFTAIVTPFEVRRTTHSRCSRSPPTPNGVPCRSPSWTQPRAGPKLTGSSSCAATLGPPCIEGPCAEPRSVCHR